jgi:hypothetical protein
MQTGLVESREEFLLPDDAYPRLQNAYVWRERILRKKGYQLLGRLQRSVDVVALALTADSVNLISGLSLEATATIVAGSISLVGSIDGSTYTDPALDGVLVATGGTGTGGTINYATGLITIAAGGAETLTGTIQYYPGLPVMGIRIRELQNSANDQTIVFDQKYAYVFDPVANAYKEFITGTTWNAANVGISGTDFFWSTNYWTSATAITVPLGPFTTVGNKLFWVTNNSGSSLGTSDPPRITDGTTWVDFTSGTWHQIDATNYLWNWLAMLPFRGRMLTFNTWEGATAALSTNNRQRIRWSTIGNPFIPYSAGPPATGSWRDDIRGQGGFLDIPTSEDIVAIGFVRDNLVIYCERSTWQLRYTGRSIAPFQIERVNAELGAESLFSAVQFDTSLLGIGDKGIVECDSYKSERIDIKIPDFVFQFASQNNGVSRVQGIRDFPNRLAYWTIPLETGYDPAIGSGSQIFPNQRLVYNYENDSWALFNDSLTALGNYQAESNRTWINTPIPWIEANFSWIDDESSAFPLILGGNQQGYVEILNQLTVNAASLYIKSITANTTTATVITSPNHNMNTEFVIGISGIPTGTAFDNLNGGIFGITVLDADNFALYLYDSDTGQFSTPQLDIPSTDYVGGGQINIRENFSVLSKKFNFLDEGQSIQLGYIDILMVSTEVGNPGAISLYVYLDYNEGQTSNTPPLNVIDIGSPDPDPDTFFNSIIPTTTSSLNTKGGTKFWQRVICPTRSNFITLQYTFSNAQLAGQEQELPVQIDAQVLWIRKAGRMTQI